jgi:hypothetical protein
MCFRFAVRDNEHVVANEHRFGSRTAESAIQFRSMEEQIMRLSTAANRWRDKITAAIASVCAEGSGALSALVPGGPTDIPMISDQAGWLREKMLRPKIMEPPILWLASDDSVGFNGQRITAARWDASLPPAEAAKRASRVIGWPELSAAQYG